MRDQPPADLVERAAAWHLVAPADWRRAARHVRRLARDLPRFDSVWIDALVQARVLTPYQASEIQVGRAESLLCGPYVLCRPAVDLGYATSFVARHRESRQTACVAVVRSSPDTAAQIAERLAGVVEGCRGVELAGILLPGEAGLDGGRAWCAAAIHEGRTAAAWLAQHGRFPVLAASEIGRQLLAAVARLESLGLAHGDLRACQVWLDRQGVVVLSWPGLRGAVRPQEGYALADLPPDSYDGLAPERVRWGGPPTAESDRYALGSLIWQLFTGRPPLTGADALARLKATQVHRAEDVRQTAPDADPAWAQAIASFLEIDPICRPSSSNVVLNSVGQSSQAGREQLAGVLRPRHPQWQVPRRRGRRQSANAGALATAAVCICLAGVTALGWSRRPQVSSRGAAAPPAVAAPLPPGLAPSLGPVPSDEVAALGGGFRPQIRSGAQSARQTQALDERAVRRASHVEPAVGDELRPDADGQWRLPAVVRRPPRRWVLADGGAIEGAPGRGSRVLVPPEGLVIVGQRFRVCRVQFVSAHPVPRAGRTPHPLLRVVGDQAEFRQCIWEGPDRSGDERTDAESWPTAVIWQRDGVGQTGELVQGDTIWSDCVFRRVATALACEREGALVAEFDNCLFVTAGSVLRMPRTPAADEPVYLGLTRTTVREVQAVMEVHLSAGIDVPGEITLQANDCVLAPAQQGTLLALSGEALPDNLLRSLHWRGQGSVVMTHGPLAVQRRATGKPRAVDGGLLSIGGLVQSEVEFAGAADEAPAASRVVRWQVPLRSAEPPGIDDARLPGGIESGRPFSDRRVPLR